MSERYIGNNAERVDILPKVTGRLRYVGDKTVQNMAHIRLITSPHPYAKILSADVSEAEKVPGVLKVYTAFNTPDKGYNSAVFYDGQDDPCDEVLFTDTARFVGDRIGAVAAESAEAAERAVELARFEFSCMTPVMNPRAALEDSAQNIQPGFEPFLFKELICGDPEKRMKEGRVFETPVSTQSLHHTAMEPHSYLAEYEDDGTVTIYSGCQLVYSVRYVTAKLLGLPFSRVRVVKAPMGGTFGGKQEVLLEPVCAYIALDLKRAARLVMSRREAMFSTRVRTAVNSAIRTAVAPDGTFIAREIDVLSDGGAYMTGGHRITVGMGKKSFRLYRIKDQVFRGTTIRTNKTPSGPFRGYGSPQIHTIMEIHNDQIAAQMGIDPVELRLKNLVLPFDDDPTGAPNLGNARVRECVERGAERFRWKEKRVDVNDGQRYRMGTGMACATHGNGYYGSAYPDFTSMSFRFTEDGRLVVDTGLHELGNGTLTSIAQIIASVLDMDIGDISILEVDTQRSPYDIGCVASRVTYACGKCAMEGAKELKDALIDGAEQAYGAKREDILLVGGKVLINGEEHSFGQVVSTIGRKVGKEVFASVTRPTVGNPGSYAAHFARVRVDTWTGLVRVTDYLAAHDVGRAINPRMIRGQILGGVQMGIGMALTEHMGWNGDGRPAIKNFSGYHVINAWDMPKVDVLLVEDGEEEEGPYGAKGVGEIATVPVAAAVVNAVNHALGLSLTPLSSLPLSPEKILAAIKA